MTAAARLRLGLALVIALFALAATPAFAEGTGGGLPLGQPSGEQPSAPGDDAAAPDDASDDPGDDTADEDSGDDATSDDTACDEQDLFAPFERWHDGRDYALGADFEDDLEDWTLDGGAHAADGNERFDVGDEGDSGSLLLPAGAQATSPPICVPDGAAFGRLFTRAAKGGRLRVEVLAVDSDGTRRAATLRGLRRGWWLSRRIALSQGGVEQVALRFTAVRGTWRVDDLYVDAG
jgi:hypothetical protein